MQKNSFFEKNNFLKISVFIFRIDFFADPAPHYGSLLGLWSISEDFDWTVFGFQTVKARG